MKKILFLLLLISSASFGQNATPFTKVKITGNTISTTATKLNVQEANGEVNTIAKTDLIDNIFVATVGDLPTTGVDGKIYVVKNVNKSYRWTGTFYQELSSTDLTGITESQVTNLVTDLGLKAPLASPTFTTQITSPIINVSGQTASTIASFDASKNVVSLPLATYPSLTELAYVKGTTSNIQTQLNTKVTLSGTTNYLIKYGTSSTQATSRILDDGTYIGIGTFNAPTKDVTLGNQLNREIGVELSDNTTIGRDLIVTAGKTINYVPNSNFNALSLGLGGYGTTSDASGNVYFRTYGGLVYKQTAGIGSFINVGNIGAPGYAIQIAANGDIYATANGYTAGDIYKAVSGSYTFTALGETSRVWLGLAARSNGDIYATANGGLYKRTGGTGVFVLDATAPANINYVACAVNGDVYITGNNKLYRQTNATGVWVDLLQTSRDYTYIACSPNGNIYVNENNGDIYNLVGGTGSLIGLGQYLSGVTGLCFIPNGNAYAETSSDIYVQNNFTVGTSNLNGGTLKLKAGTGKGIGTSNLELYTGQKTASGTDMQVETLRLKIDNEGLVTLPSTTNALITADTTGKALVTKEYLSTISGGATNLSYTASPTNIIINSSTGTGATIALGNGTNAGVTSNDYTTEEKTKVSNLSGTNTGDNATNTNYASDYRASNFVAGTNYQEPLTNPVTGTGTTNYLPKYTGASTIALSTIYDNGSIGIGTNNPMNKTDISGSLAVGSGYAGTYAAPTDGAIIQGNVGIGTNTSSTNKLSISDTNLAGSGALAGSALNIAQTWNTTGNPTAIKLNVTNTATGASSSLMDLQVGGVSQFIVSKTGQTVSTGASYASFFSGSNIALTGTGGATVGNINVTATYSNLGSYRIINLSPTYNQTSGTAANTDIFLNRTTTAVGSGVQLLMDLQNNAVSKFNVTPTGITTTTKLLLNQTTDLGASLQVTGASLQNGNIFFSQPTPIALTATGTLTIAQILTGLETVTSATAVSLTLPTGILTDAGILGGLLPVQNAFEWTIINLGSATGIVTLVGGTGHTIVGLATIPILSQGTFRTTKTATNTFITYRVY